jgi:exodeoxyribonuclease VII small subunit
MAKKNENRSYEKAIEELEDIIEGLENESIGVDELSEKVKRASELIALCKSKLFKTDQEVKNILSALNESDEED